MKPVRGVRGRKAVKLEAPAIGLGRRTRTRSIDSPPARVVRRDCCACSGEGVKTPATHTCASCGDKDFCEPHGRVHQTLRSHQLKRLRFDGDVPVVEAGPAPCPDHPGQVCDRFCLDHRLLVCPECCVYDHVTSSHDVRPITDIKADIFVRLSDALPTLDVRIGQAADATARVEAQLTALRQAEMDSLRCIDETSEYIQKALNECVSDARSRMLKAAESRSAETAAAAAAWRVEGNQLSSLRDVCVDALEQGDPHVLAAVLQDVGSQSRWMQEQRPAWFPSSFQVMARTEPVVAAMRDLFRMRDAVRQVDASMSELKGPGVRLDNDPPVLSWLVSLSPKDAAGVPVRVRPGEVDLSIKGAAGTQVGTSNVAIDSVGNIDIKFYVQDLSIIEAKLKLRIQGFTVHRWVAPLVRSAVYVRAYR
jgi:hypothetical protein